MNDIIKYALKSLWGRRLRSFLTILSILISISAIFALVSFGQGIREYVDDFATKQGTDKILMSPGGFVPPGTSTIIFTKNDIDFIGKIKGVDEVVGMMAASGKVGFKDYKEKYVYMFGMPTDTDGTRLVEEMFTVGIEKGRNLKDGDVLKVALGYNYLIPDKLFKRAVNIGDKIEINDVQVEVIGFYKQVGNPSDDSQVYLTYEGMEKIFGTKSYEYIGIRAASGQDPKQVADKIKERFRDYKGQKKGEEDFFVQTFEDVIKMYNNVITIINGVLVLIALVSVVVAGVNITNTTYTSVLERTKEIGVMKSIGAKNNFILMIFMFESGFLGFVGGAIGIGFGYLISKIGEYIAEFYGLAMLRPAFPLWLIISCLVFAFLVGAVAGLLPAIQASKQNPVDALRYE